MANPIEILAKYSKNIFVDQKLKVPVKVIKAFEEFFFKKRKEKKKSGVVLLDYVADDHVNCSIGIHYLLKSDNLEKKTLQNL